MNHLPARTDRAKPVYRFILLATLLAFLLITLGFSGGTHRSRYNLIPLQRLIRRGLCLFNICEEPPNPFFFMLNLVGNTLILAPVGFSLFHLSAANGYARRKRILLALSLALIISISVETIQVLYAGRYGDADDVLLNGLGALAGAWIASRQEKRRRPARER